MNKSFVVGVDHNMQDLIPWWYENVKNYHPDIHITIADFGLTESALDWISGRVDKIITYERHPRYAWFYKPQAMLECPYEYTCWLDIDCEVLMPVEEIFDFPTDERMALTVDVARGDFWWATGVNVVKGKPKILQDWAHNTMRSDLRGDQEVLYLSRIHI